MSKISPKTMKIIRLSLICVLAAVFIVSAVMFVNSLIGYKQAADLYEQAQDEFLKNIGTDPAVTANEIWTREPPTTASSPDDDGTGEYPDTDGGYDDSGDSYDDESSNQETTAPPEPLYSEKFLKACEGIRQFQEKNEQVFGVIEIKFTETNYILYPLVRGEDNEYYVTHAYDKTELNAGSIFLDYRCSTELSRNMVSLFFGHNMNNGAMFQKLTYFKQRQYFDNVSVVIYTLEGIYTYEVFSVYNTNTGSDYSNVFFDTDMLYGEFLKDIQNTSLLSKDIKLSQSDKIITLSTCLNTTATARLSVHAVLVRIEI